MDTYGQTERFKGFFLTWSGCFWDEKHCVWYIARYMPIFWRDRFLIWRICVYLGMLWDWGPRCFWWRFWESCQSACKLPVSFDSPPKNPGAKSHAKDNARFNWSTLSFGYWLIFESSPLVSLSAIPCHAMPCPRIPSHPIPSLTRLN